MKIMSFNTQSCTNYITQEIDYKIMGDAIKKCDADIVGLNEIHEESHMENYSFQTRKVAEAAGFPYYKFGQACTLEEGNFKSLARLHGYNVQQKGRRAGKYSLSL